MRLLPALAALGCVLGVAGWLVAGEVVRERLSDATGRERGPLTILLWPAALVAHGAAWGALRAVGALFPEPRDDLAPFRGTGVRDDGAWLHPERALLAARVRCELEGHDRTEVAAAESREPVRAFCGRCGDELPLRAAGPDAENG